MTSNEFITLSAGVAKEVKQGKETKTQEQESMHTHAHTRTYNVRLTMKKSITAKREQTEGYKSQTSSQLVRIIAHKHALGYKLNSVQYVVETGNWLIILCKNPTTKIVGSRRFGIGTLVYDFDAHEYIQTSPDRDFVRSTTEGRQ